MKKTLLLLMLFNLLSCSNDDLNDTNQLYIRLSNSSDFKFENTTYNGINFGDIEPGYKTEYRLVGEQYTSLVSIFINGNEYDWGNFYIGEQPLLDNGNFTYEFFFDESTETLTSELVED